MISYSYYNNEKAGDEVAFNLIEGNVNATLSLISNPHLGRKEELLSNKPIKLRYLIYKNYKIVIGLIRRKV